MIRKFTHEVNPSRLWLSPPSLLPLSLAFPGEVRHAVGEDEGGRIGFGNSPSRNITR